MAWPRRMLEKPSDDVVGRADASSESASAAGTTSIADLAYAAELDRRRLFHYARMLLAANATNNTGAANSTSTGTTTDAANSTNTGTTTDAANSTSTDSNSTSTDTSATGAADAGAPAAATPPAESTEEGLMNSPAAGAAIGGGAASALGGIVGKYKAQFEKLKEVKAKLMPKLEMSKELATKIAKEVP